MNTVVERTHLDGGRHPPPAWRGWRKIKPGYHKRRVMFATCGRKCFLRPPYRYPICQSAKTCKINRKGLMAGYIRARQYHDRIATKKARNILRRMTRFMCVATRRRNK